MRFGFVGPAYALASPLADNEALINWRPQKTESPNARTAWLLLRTAGLSLFADLAAAAGVAALPSVRGSTTAQGRTFFVAGTHLFETNANGVVTDYGANPGTANNNIVDDGLKATMVEGGTVGGAYPSQLLICSGGALTVFSLVTNTFQALTTPPANNLMVDFLDGFFLALSAGNTWSVSAPEDATTWPGISVTQVQVFSDQLLAIIASNELAWVFGATRAVAYYNSGAPLFPFDVASGSFMEVGLIAQYSPQRVATRRGTTIIWLGGDERGAAMVYAANGFIPQRVSDSGLEYWLSRHVISDAVGMARQEEGQNFYDLWFPSANTTWTLDVDLGWWHQRSSLVAGQAAAHRQRCHTYNFGLHLIGDRLSGNVYSMSSLYLAENIGPTNSIPIVRTRVGPTIENEGGQLTSAINEFQVDFDTGQGPQPPLVDGNNQPRDPVAMFSYSEDYGRTFTPERVIPCGQAGQFKQVAIDRRLGSWRSWTPKVVVSDPVAWAMADAYVNGTQQQAERNAKRMAQVS
jgi:hypothetical protein